MESEGDRGYITSEYQAIVEYHTSIFSSRFTVAGLYVAAVGFVAAAVFEHDTSLLTRLAGSLLALWLTICLWILELRNGSLALNIAERGKYIETNYFKPSYNSGDKKKDIECFFSRQYREDSSTIDRPRIPFAKKQMPVRMSRPFSHSIGLDLLYGGGIIFWIGLLTVVLCKKYL